MNSSIRDTLIRRVKHSKYKELHTYFLEQMGHRFFLSRNDDEDRWELLVCDFIGTIELYSPICGKTLDEVAEKAKDHSIDLEAIDLNRWHDL